MTSLTAAKVFERSSTEKNLILNGYSGCCGINWESTNCLNAFYYDVVTMITSSLKYAYLKETKL